MAYSRDDEVPEIVTFSAVPVGSVKKETKSSMSSGRRWSNRGVAPSSSSPVLPSPSSETGGGGGRFFRGI